MIIRVIVNIYTIYYLVFGEMHTDNLFEMLSRFSADYIPVSDAGIFSDDALEQRKAKEAKSIQTWKGEVKGLTSLRDLHGWLHRTHVCYSVSRQSEFGSVGAHDNEALKQSY